MSLSSAEILVMIAEIAPTTLHNVVAIGQKVQNTKSEIIVPFIEVNIVLKLVWNLKLKNFVIYFLYVLHFLNLLLLQCVHSIKSCHGRTCTMHCCIANRMCTGPTGYQTADLDCWAPSSGGYVYIICRRINRILQLIPWCRSRAWAREAGPEASFL